MPPKPKFKKEEIMADVADMPVFKQIGMKMVMFGIQEPKLYQLLGIQEHGNAVSAGSTVLGTIVQELVAGFAGAPVLPENTYDCESAVFIGIMFIVMSIFCKYGAEIIEDRKMIQP